MLHVTRRELVDLFNNASHWDTRFNVGSEHSSRVLVAGSWDIEDAVRVNTLLVVEPFLHDDTLVCTTLGENVDWDTTKAAQNKSNVESELRLFPDISLQASTNDNSASVVGVGSQAEWLQFTLQDLSLTLLGLLVINVHLSLVESLVNGEASDLRFKFIDIDSLLLGISREVNSVEVVVLLRRLNQNSVDGKVTINAVLLSKDGGGNDGQQDQKGNNLHVRF